MFPFKRFTEHAKTALSLAEEEAASNNHSYVGTEHVLLALLREERGLGGRVLRELGADLDTVRPQIESSRVGTEHILLGLMIEGEGIAAHVLEDLGATRNRVIERVAEETDTAPATGKRPPRSNLAKLRALRTLGATSPPVSHQVVLLLDAAVRIAGEEGASEVSEEHLRRALERNHPPAEETSGG
ncbi:MAG TPA: Clp protease N-terminal domain-containing protein [Candidatus Dormibacteraeota bacterium]|jgi:ATP-dependent Clp protease ATP-binding subunit ClpA|nr:Clp protease N-terminal domain-containing protein [Candidatus Dormibacteraeota bacterium]